MLAQHAVLLDYVGQDSTHALYRSAVEVGRAQLKVLMPLQTYAEMDEQEQITVTIRPGSDFTDLDVAFQVPPGE